VVNILSFKTLIYHVIAGIINTHDFSILMVAYIQYLNVFECKLGLVIPSLSNRDMITKFSIDVKAL
jgi:hypothetical protein